MFFHTKMYFCLYRTVFLQFYRSSLFLVLSDIAETDIFFYIVYKVRVSPKPLHVHSRFIPPSDSNQTEPPYFP